ncbi:MAG: hypothetical protein KY437_00270 [Actinobacteria bacterium]|nr:hypothetical protein [Actinomycetota bacterium]
MRIHRIALREVKGVRRCDVTLWDGDGGVTVVEGANEVGKSTLAEALELLLEHYDSTTRSEVRALQPVDRDAGSEIEIEVSTGPYRFTYFKRFNRDTETRLTVTEPTPESLTGREAHDRVRQILDETIDVDLWEALQVRQGADLEQAAVGHASALVRAIDDQVSATAIGPRESQLYDRICGEYERYWTPTGRESKTLKDSAAAVEQAEDALQQLETRLSELERDIEHVGTLERRIPELRGQATAAARNAAEHASTLREVEDLEQRVTRCRLAVQKAEAQRTTAADRLRARRDLIDELARAEEELGKREEEAEGGEERTRRATQDLEAATAELHRLRAELRDAEQLADRRRRDLDHLRDLESAEQLRERQRRVTAANERRTAALTQLEDIRVDAQLLDRLREQHLAVERARASLEVGSSTLHLLAEADLDLTVDGEPLAVAAGGETTWTATEDLELQVPGIGTLTVRPGAGIEPLTRTLEDAEAGFGALLAEAGVDDLAAAERAVSRRRDAEATATSATRARTDALDGITTDELEDRITRVELRTEGYELERPADPPMATDLEEAVDLRDAADRAATATRERFEDARASEEQARGVLDEVRDAHTDRGVKLEVARERVTSLTARLDEARAQTGDDELDAQVSELDAAVEAAEQQLAAAEQQLAAADPDAVRALARNADETIAAARARLREAEDELGSLQATIEMRGGEGIAAARDAASATLAHVRDEDRSLRRRAEAARLLYDTFTECREEAKRTYARPLREQIVKLGRILFDPSFDVILDEDLRIEQRVLDGVPLPFEQLSGGAKEQLALIGRLACAMLVADDGGAPLIIDDSLGYSDPERLEAMGAILRLAGKECQVVVLTCYPERYRHVGGARTVRIA